MAVLDKDPRTVAVDKTNENRVLKTWMDGAKVFMA
jgi:predicted amidohydrolase YtcJ